MSPGIPWDEVRAGPWMAPSTGTLHALVVPWPNCHPPAEASPQGCVYHKQHFFYVHVERGTCYGQGDRGV